MDKLKTILKRYWPSALTLAVVIYATLFPDPVGAEELPPIPHIDKLIHAVMMGGLFGAIVFDTQRCNRDKKLKPRFLVVTALAVTAFSIADEIAQASLIEGRSGDILDLAADWAGIAAAYFLAPPVVRKVLKVAD